MDPMSLCNFLLGYSTVCIDQMNLDTFPVGLLNCVHGPNESGHISCWATQLCADQMNLGTFPVGLFNCVHGPNESGHILCWATQLCIDPVNRGTFSIIARLINYAWIQCIWAHFLLSLSTVWMDPMNLGLFSVGLLNCVHGPNESGHISSWATQLCSWTQWIWAHFLLGYSSRCMDPMNLGKFPVMLINCVHGPNESGHIFC